MVTLPPPPRAVRRTFLRDAFGFLCRGDAQSPNALVESMDALSCRLCGVPCSLSFHRSYCCFSSDSNVCSQTEDSGRQEKGKQASPGFCGQLPGDCLKNKTPQLGLEPQGQPSG